MTNLKNLPTELLPEKVLHNLTAEQEAYARARATGMNIAEAITAANVSCKLSTVKRSWEALDSPVKKRIQVYTEQIAKNAIMKSGLDRSWVINRLMTVVDRCMQAEEVLDRKGEPTGEFTFDSNGANRALHLLGLELGMFKPQEEKPGDEYANLSDDDITRIAAELATQTGLIEYIEGTEETAGSKQIITVQAISEAD